MSHVATVFLAMDSLFLQLCTWLLLPTLTFLLADTEQAKTTVTANWTSERLLFRMKRNKFVKKFIEKSKASQEKVRELEDQGGHDWPVIAWKTHQDVFQIGDDRELESSIFKSVIEEDIQTLMVNVTDFSLKPASSYKSLLTQVRSRINLYHGIFIGMSLIMGLSNFVIVFIRYWLGSLLRLILRAGLRIEFPGHGGPARQEFIYALAVTVEDDLLERPATKAEQGFAACINDVVVAVESYTKSH